MDGSHILEESDLLEPEADDVWFGLDDVEGKDVYILLNLDGSLPFSGN